MVTAHHDRLTRCLDGDPPRWVVRLRERLIASSQGVNKSVPEAVGATEIPDANRSDSERESDSLKSKPAELYCVCHGPDTGSFMIYCNHCEGWFHSTCVGVSTEEAKTIDKYYCPSCVMTKRTGVHTGLGWEGGGETDAMD